MSFLDRILGRKAEPVAAYNPADWEALITSIPTAAGISVTPANALRSPTLLACVRAVSEAVGMMAVKVRQRDGDGWKAVDDHPAALLTNHWANGWDAATTLRTQLQVDAMLHGEAFAQVIKTGKKPIALNRLLPGSVGVKLDETSGEPSYQVTTGAGETVTLSYRDVLHIATPGASLDRPMALINLARESIAVEIAMLAHQGSTFRNGGLPRIVLSPRSNIAPGQIEISPDALKNSLKFFRAQLAKNDGAPILLPQDFAEAFKSFGMRDMQFTELLQRVSQNIAAAMRVPGPAINDLSASTYNNVEHASRDLIQKAILPWTEVWEAAYTRVLIDPKDRVNLEIEFIVRDMLRGDFKSQSEAYRLAGGGAYLSVNEIRALDGYPPHPDGNGLIKQAGQTDKPKDPPEPA
ncbi:MAG TPA: phage portal protein [Devosia sp.]|jgi:HK97 family phage portal protein|nr:phage portal protein [Devosia sp.]